MYGDSINRTNTHLCNSVQSALVPLTARGLEFTPFIIHLKAPDSPILTDQETEAPRGSSLSKGTWLKENRAVPILNPKSPLRAGLCAFSITNRR